MKSVIPLITDTDESIWLAFYEFKKAYNQKYLIDVSKDVADFKEVTIQFLNSYPNFNSHLFIKDNEVVGTYNTFLLNKGLPEEKLDVKVFFLDENILEEFNAEIISLIQQNKSSVKKVKANIENNNLQKTFQTQGFRNANESIWFHLKLENINKELVDNILQTNIPKNNNLTIELNKELRGNSITDVAHLMTTLLNDMKRDDNHETFKQTPEELKEIVNSHKKSKGNLFHLLLRNEKNELIGVCIVVFKKDNPIAVNQFMTGVLKEYRGLGLPTWMKAYIYDYLQKNYPTIQLIKTDCFADNTPMVHINKKMGFEEIELTTEMVYEKN